jgi:hypothetical protein
MRLRHCLSIGAGAAFLLLLSAAVAEAQTCYSCHTVFSEGEPGGSVYCKTNPDGQQSCHVDCVGNECDCNLSGGGCTGFAVDTWMRGWSGTLAGTFLAQGMAGAILHAWYAATILTSSIPACASATNSAVKVAWKGDNPGAPSVHPRHAEELAGFNPGR